MSDEPPIRPSLLKASYSRTLEAVVLKALEEEAPKGAFYRLRRCGLRCSAVMPQAFELMASKLRVPMAGHRGRARNPASVKRCAALSLLSTPLRRSYCRAALRPA